METTKQNILNQSFGLLDVSEECFKNMKGMNLFCLQDFINKGWQGLHDSEGFDYRSFNEIIKLLSSYDLLYLMEHPL